MNLIYSILLWGFCWSSALAQLIIDKGIYKVNFSNTMHVPRYVSYYLYKGGGTCDRDKMNFTFKNDMPEALCAKDADYNFKKWGYQKGHLANAEDFAMSCKKEELTFRYSEITELSVTELGKKLHSRIILLK
jgi:endonuclease G